MARSKIIVPGGADRYIASCPKEVQGKLKKIRAAIRSVAPHAVETMSYFGMPGYSCGEDRYYNGMFIWFSFKKPAIRLHIIPPVIEDHKKDVAAYTVTKSVVSFPDDGEVPVALVKKLAKASLKVTKER